MKLYAPKYYKDFVCIADKCRHSCCVGWEIDVDENTLEKYNSSEEGYAEKIRESIDSEDTPHFRLLPDERCPHLNSSGLCNIILNLGEDYLCHICREHPRFYNDTVRGSEVGLGLVCEEACRLILSSDDYATMIKIGGADDIFDPDFEFDALPERASIYEIISERAIPYSERLKAVGEKYSVSPEDIPDERWRELLSTLEYLNGEDKKLFSPYSSDRETPRELEKYLERALAYFIFRHVSPAEDETDFRVSLGLALFFERLLCSAVVAFGDISESAIFDISRRLSEELEYSEENTDAIKFEFFFL